MVVGLRREPPPVAGQGRARVPAGCPHSGHRARCFSGARASSVCTGVGAWSRLAGPVLRTRAGDSSEGAV